MAAIVAAIYNVHRDRKRQRRPYTPEDILGRKRRRTQRRARTPEEQLAVLRRLTQALGGEIRYSNRARIGDDAS